MGAPVIERARRPLAGGRAPGARKAVFRFDASAKIGLGHAVRCLALADALRESGWATTLAVLLETLDAAPELRLGGHHLLVLTAADEAALLPACELLVVDHYGLGREFEQVARLRARRILVLDDLCTRAHDCDLLLDPTPGRSEADYRGLVDGACRLLLGPAHALLRPAFPRLRAESLRRRAADEPVLRLLVAVGGMDRKNVTQTILKGIAASGLALAVDVALAPGAPHLAALRGRLEPRLTLHAPAADMAALMASADLALGGAGSTSWERCCLGLPALVTVVAENQRAVARRLAEAGAVRLLPDARALTPDDVSAALRALVADGAARRRMSEAAARLCDGRGVERALAAIRECVP